MKEEERKKLFVELLNKYEERIFNLIYWKVGDYEEAKDLTQDVFLKAYKALDKFRGEATHYTWLYRIALNHTNRYLKKRSLLRFLSLEKVDPGRVYHDPDEEREIEWEKRKLELIKEKIPRLPEKYKDAIVLYYFDGRTYEEIAEILGISIGTVKSRLSRGRELLSRWLRSSSAKGRK